MHDSSIDIPITYIFIPSFCITLYINSSFTLHSPPLASADARPTSGVGASRTFLLVLEEALEKDVRAWQLPAGA